MVDPKQLKTVTNIAPTELKWDDIHIEVTKIKPNKAIAPLKLQETEDGLSVALHFTSNSVSGWPGVAVVVATLSSRIQTEITDIQLRPVLPRGCRLKLMPPSSTSLPPFSPFTPPPAMTQVMVLGKSTTCPTPSSVSYVLSYMTEGETVTDIGKDIQLPGEIWADCSD